ncbi:MAG: hypothetical protein AB7I30_18130 [Isosphaeraceae bacterium]
MWRGVLAVLAGYLVVVVLTMATFALQFPEEMRQAMRGEEVSPPSIGTNLGLLGVGAVTAVIGGAVAGFVGGGGVRHGRALGVVMVILGLV